MNPIDIQAHHDGHGLNDLHTILADERDPNGGNASHHYRIPNPGSPLGPLLTVQFQQGPRDEDGSVHGITDAALIAVVLDRYAGFQAGPHRCRENALVVTKLEEALMWMQKRANDRARRGVLGKNAE